MQNKVTEFLYQNIIAFLVILFITFINGQSYPFVGNLVWLPVGAVSLCYLLFGFRIVIAVFIAISFSAHLGDVTVFPGHNLIHLVGTLAPLVAIASMKFFKLSYFFDGGKIVFQHLLFLGILTALYNTLMKFFAYSYLASASGGSLSIDALQFIKNYLIGDILGSLIILFFAALVIVPGIRYFAPKLVPSEYKSK